MKKILLFVVAAPLIWGCTSNRETSQEISWAAFCSARGYNLDEGRAEVLIEYLDTWRGSAAEEAAFDAAGVKPF